MSRPKNKVIRVNGNCGDHAAETAKFRKMTFIPIKICSRVDHRKTQKKASTVFNACAITDSKATTLTRFIYITSHQELEKQIQQSVYRQTSRPNQSRAAVGQENLTSTTKANTVLKNRQLQLLLVWLRQWLRFVVGLEYSANHLLLLSTKLWSRDAILTIYLLVQLLKLRNLNKMLRST